MNTHKTLLILIFSMPLVCTATSKDNKYYDYEESFIDSIQTVGKASYEQIKKQNKTHRHVEPIRPATWVKKFKPKVFWNKMPQGFPTDRIDCIQFVSKIIKNQKTNPNNILNFMFVEVPMDLYNPAYVDPISHRSTTYAFMWGEFPVENEAYRPLVFYHGGPGNTSHYTLNNYFDVIRYRGHLSNRKPLEPGMKELFSFFNIEAFPPHNNMKKINFLTQDQRGTGCSIMPSIYNTDIKDMANSYSSQGTVFDSEVLRLVLSRKYNSFDKWSILGQSYGGIVVRRYLEKHPEGLAAAFSHGMGAVDTLTKKLGRDQIQWTRQLMERYYNTYPEDREKIMYIHKHGPRGKHSLSFGKQRQNIDLSALFDSFYIKLIFMPKWASLHQQIAQIYGEIKYAESSGLLLESRLFMNSTNKAFTRLIGYTSPGVISDNQSDIESYILHFLTARSDYIDHAKFIESYESDKNYYQQMEDAYDEHYTGSAYDIFSEVRQGGSIQSSLKSQVYKHLDLGNIPMEGIDLETVRTNMNNFRIPFYNYRSEFDPITPPQNFTAENAFFAKTPTYKFTLLNNSAHDGYYSEAQVWQDLVSNIVTNKQ